MSNGLLPVRTLESPSTPTGPPVFVCTKCGLCCTHLNRATAYADLDRGDGTCRNFDSINHLCKIYSTRPLICRVDDFYEQNLASYMSKDEYVAANLNACADAQRAHQLDSTPTH